MSGSRLGRKAWAPSLIRKLVLMDVAAWFTDDFLKNFVLYWSIVD